MKRNPRKLKWTKAFRKAAGKEMTVDTTLQFAARRNVPVRYNRDLVEKTLHAMRRVSEIRARRERVFYRKRMAGNRLRELEAARKLVETHSHLLPKLRGSVQKRLREAELLKKRALTAAEVKELEKTVVRERKKKMVSVQAVGEDGEMVVEEVEEEIESEDGEDTYNGHFDDDDEMEYEMEEEIGNEIEVGGESDEDSPFRR
jgi:large subunit ribosomal protein L24e